MTDPKPPGDRDEQQEQEKWYERTQYHILLFAGGIAYIGAVLWMLLDLYIDPQTSAQKRDLVQALGFILAGVAGAIGIYFTWRGQRITRESLERSREHTENQLQLTREGQSTERFTNAIEQLGAADDQGRKSLELRLGGVYALERIARESEEDHWSIMEVLTAYVRQHARWTPEESQEHTENSAAEEESEKDSRRRESQISGVALDADIQAILTVLRRRARSFGHGEPEPLDLHETNLTGANLSGVNLRKADLSEADLSEADLSEADLSGVAGADLSGAKRWLAEISPDSGSGGLPMLVSRNLFEEAYRLRKSADLGQADLGGADLEGADLSKANLRRADLSGARGFIQEQLESTMTGDKHTQLPSDLTPPAHWNVKPDKQTEGN